MKNDIADRDVTDLVCCVIDLKNSIEPLVYLEDGYMTLVPDEDHEAYEVGILHSSEREHYLVEIVQALAEGAFDVELTTTECGVPILYLSRT